MPLRPLPNLRQDLWNQRFRSLLFRQRRELSLNQFFQRLMGGWFHDSQISYALSADRGTFADSACDPSSLAEGFPAVV